MKILITGAGGMLGTDVVAELRSDFELSGIGLSSGAHLGIPYYEKDLCDLGEVNAVVDEEKPDLLMHFAAMTNVDLCETQKDDAWKANVDATKNVVSCANRLNIPVIFISTDFVFDGESKKEYSENESLNPLSYYGLTKARAEEYVREFAKAYVIFRVSWLFGRYGKSFPRTILELAEKQQKFRVVSDQIGRPTYTKDVARALKTLLSGNREIFHQIGRETFHLTNQGVTSWADFTREILALAGLKKHEVEDISSGELNRPARRPHHAVLSLAKTKESLGISLRPWQEAIKDFVNELKEEVHHLMD